MNKEDMTTFNMNIPEELKLRLKIFAARRKVSMTKLILDAIEDYLLVLDE